jgi:plasmid stabilization system protein ParE
VNVAYLPIALREFDDAVDWYERCQPGLGTEFVREFASAVATVAESPEAWRLIDRDRRAFAVKRFPYRIIYVVRAGGVLVIAVAHTSRRQGYWAAR